MTKDEIFTSIRQAGMIPVPIRTEGDIEIGPITLFEGPLDKFLITAKELGAKAIFVEATELDDWLFTYNQIDERDDEEAVDEDLELLDVHPPLSRFKKYLGQPYTFFLTAKGGVTDLNFELSEEWVEEFEDELDHAREKADSQLITDKLKREERSRN